MKWLSNDKKLENQAYLKLYSVFGFWFSYCVPFFHRTTSFSTPPILYPYSILLYRLYLLFISNQKVQTKNLK